MTKIVLRQPETRLEVERQQAEERARQMRERGSVSGLRGYKPQITVDIYAEKVSGNLFLVTPATRAGANWVRASLAKRVEYLFFCNGLILDHNDFQWLLHHRPDSLCFHIENYLSAEEIAALNRGEKVDA